MLGLNWAARMCSTYTCILTQHQRPVEVSFAQSLALDLTDGAGVRSAVSSGGYSAVIHCAGLTNIEACERDPDGAHVANVVTTLHLASACAAAGVFFVYISTDHLFAGGGAFLGEDVLPAPQNIYARTKAAGESIALALCPSALVVRTNFFGWGPRYKRSFADHILALLQLGQKVDLFEDVFFTPIYMGHLIDTVHQLLDTKMTGVFNIVGCDRVSKFDFGQRIAETFAAAPTHLHTTCLADRPDLVRRPKDMSLSPAKIHTTLGLDAPSLDEGLKAMRSDKENARLCEVRQL